VGPEAYTILGFSLRERIKIYEYKIRFESEYLFIRRKEITRNYKSNKKADTHHKHYKIQKNNTFLLTA
jgi:hypothetical protein